ncbi:serine protease filzig-like [Manduca sexta]|uniref:serine protease filzig-like n=1 Tax=Manduca sexta TaxID=7130 RepID=UPI00188E325B|nr:serine protease filzig-like [Manduca sexta]
MLFCVTCVLCVTVAARAHPRSVETVNITQPGEKRYGIYYHPPEYSFPTPPYNYHHPEPHDEGASPPYGDLNLPPPPYGDPNYSPSELPCRNEYPSSGNENPLQPYGNLNLPPPPYGDPNSYTPSELPYNNQYQSTGNESPIQPYHNSNFPPSYDDPKSYTPLPNNNQYPPPGNRNLPLYGDLNRKLPQYNIQNPNIPPSFSYNEYLPPGDRSSIPPFGNLNQTLPKYILPTFDSDRTSLSNRESSQLISSEDEEDPCNPHFSEKPDFLAGGRRISEAKCMGYVWNLQRMQEIENKRILCEIETKRKQTGYYPAVPAAVGGRAAFPGEFPHMGAIGWLGLKGEWLFKCGSSLISPKFVLTAAHCSKASALSTDLADPVPKIVRLSHVNIDLATRDTVHLKYDVNIERIIVHPNYKPPKKYYDIALMELDHEVGFWQMVHPACLWTSPDVKQLSAIATLTGWGVLKEGNLDISPNLQAAVVDFIGQHRCDALLAKKRNRHWSGLQEHQLCAGKLAGGVDACQGDSGGPLQVPKKLDINTPYKLYYVVGVTAFGFGCARRNLPGVYTRVSSFLDWIEPIVWP